MTDAQRRFCDEYLIDLNATRAYKVAYPNCKKDDTAKSAGSRLLTNVNLQNYISEKMEEREKRTEVTQDMVIKELAKIAFLDIRKLYTENGQLKNVADIDDDTAGAISSLETLEEYDGYGDDREKIGDTQKVKLLDKTKALELLGRHLGIFNDKLDVNVKEKEEKKNAISDILNQMQNVDDV
jgi:phage terminase small subunit